MPPCCGKELVPCPLVSVVFIRRIRPSGGKPSESVTMKGTTIRTPSATVSKARSSKAGLFFGHCEEESNGSVCALPAKTKSGTQLRSHVSQRFTAHVPPGIPCIPPASARMRRRSSKRPPPQARLHANCPKSPPKGNSSHDLLTPLSLSLPPTTFP